MAGWINAQAKGKSSTAQAANPDVPTEAAPSVTMYDEPPAGEVTLEEFECFAIDRLRVLRGIEDAKAKRSQQDQLQALVLQLADKHLRGGSAKEMAWRDEVSHWVLRLAYCRSEDLRRWFLAHECELFRHRFSAQLADTQVAFLKAAALPYESVEGAEFEALKPDLIKVQEALGHKDFAARIRLPDSRDAFFKVPFEAVPDLVASRRVLVRGGTAYVARHEVASLAVGHFRAALSRGLAVAARRWAQHISSAEADRIAPLAAALAQRYLGPDYGEGGRGAAEAITAAQVPQLARESFPLCMQNMLYRLEQDRHLKHFGRQTFSLFLKAIGLPLEEAVRFWRAMFAPRDVGEAFDKKYLYNIRHNYGQAGKRTDYSPHSCLKLIAMPVARGEAYGCPYKTMSAGELGAALGRMRLAPGAVAEAAAKAKAGHFQLACAAAWEGAHGCECISGINHPNQYYEESRKVLVERESKQGGGGTTGAPATPAVERLAGARPNFTAPSMQNRT